MSLQDRLNRAVKCADKVQDGCCHEEMADAYQRAYELMHNIACEAIAENITLRLEIERLCKNATQRRLK